MLYKHMLDFQPARSY